MKRMISAILLASAIWSVCADERITYPASDGVNEVTARVRNDGVVVPERITTAYVEPPTNADTETQKEAAKPEVEKVTAYRIHLYTNADGSEVAYVVGADGIERPVVLLDPDEYKLLTERLESVWRSFHATAEGRKKLHGKIVRTEINEKARQKVEIYVDGYRHTETLPEKRKPADAKKTRLQTKTEEQKPKGMSDKQWEMRQAFERHKRSVPKQVTVEHDAATGKDTIQEASK